MNWFVLITGINQELLAQRGLSAKGYECYCPLASRSVRHARVETIKTVPLFSRYLFILFDHTKQQWPDRSIDGVKGIIVNDFKPVKVPSHLIEDIKKREVNGEFHVKQKSEIERRRWLKSFDTLKDLLKLADCSA